MPGVIHHLIVGCALFAIGRISFRVYFKGDQKHKRELLLAVVCLTFSILPDFFLGIYYLTRLEPFNVLLPYQVFTHFILTPIAVGALFLLAFLFDTKRRPLWIIGCISTHRSHHHGFIHHRNQLLMVMIYSSRTKYFFFFCSTEK